MKVRLSYTIEVHDDIREAINAYYGRPGLASREQVRDWYRQFGDSMNEDLGLELSAERGYRPPSEFDHSDFQSWS
jgi:hypothetical protein